MNGDASSSSRIQTYHASGAPVAPDLVRRPSWPQKPARCTGPSRARYGHLDRDLDRLADMLFEELDCPFEVHLWSLALVDRT
jgi:hypothetical protein